MSELTKMEQINNSMEGKGGSAENVYLLTLMNLTHTLIQSTLTCAFLHNLTLSYLNLP